MFFARFCCFCFRLFLDLGLKLAVGHVQKRTKKDRIVWKRMKTYKNVEKSLNSSQNAPLQYYSIQQLLEKARQHHRVSKRF